MIDIQKHFYSGTSGLVLPTNKDHFPAEFQDKSRLEYYASLFNSVEINSTFYKLPKGSTLKKWSENVPESFEFTLKLPKIITHSKNLDYSLNDLEEFIEITESITDKKGCLLIQFPPSIKIEKYNKVQSLLKDINDLVNTDSWKIAVEFRDSSWYISEVYELLEELSIALVLHDMTKAATGWNLAQNSFVYLRFHGPEPRYRGNYSDDFLKKMAEQIKLWIKEDKTVYAYFNNTMGAAFKNLETLNKYVHF